MGFSRKLPVALLIFIAAVNVARAQGDEPSFEEPVLTSPSPPPPPPPFDAVILLDALNAPAPGPAAVPAPAPGPNQEEIIIINLPTVPAPAPEVVLDVATPAPAPAPTVSPVSEDTPVVAPSPSEVDSAPAAEPTLAPLPAQEIVVPVAAPVPGPSVIEIAPTAEPTLAPSASDATAPAPEPSTSNASSPVSAPSQTPVPAPAPATTETTTTPVPVPAPTTAPVDSAISPSTAPAPGPATIEPTITQVPAPAPATSNTATAPAPSPVSDNQGIPSSAVTPAPAPAPEVNPNETSNNDATVPSAAPAPAPTAETIVEDSEAAAPAPGPATIIETVVNIPTLAPTMAPAPAPATTTAGSGQDGSVLPIDVPAPAPAVSTGDAPSPAAINVPSPSPSVPAAQPPVQSPTLPEATAPSPAAAPIPSPVESSPPPPVDVSPPSPIEGGAPAIVTCTGYAYDGYLSSCQVYFDANGDSLLDVSEARGASESGVVSIDVTSPAQMAGALRLVPAAGSLTSPVDLSSPVCYDMATMLPERLPLATPAPESCVEGAAPSVISALSTLLTAGVVSQEALKQALALPGSNTIGRYNALKASLEGDADAQAIMKAEAAVRNLVLLGTQAFVSDPALYQKIASTAFATLAARIAEMAPATSAPRPLLMAASTLDLADASLVASVLSSVQQQLESDMSIPLDGIQHPSEEIKAVLSEAVSNINTLVNTASTPEEVQKATYMAQTDISGNVAGLVDGTITPAAFEVATSPETMEQTLASTELPPGAVLDPEAPAPSPVPSPPPADSPADAEGDNDLALGLGLGLDSDDEGAGAARQPTSDTRLHRAAFNDDVPAVKSLLAESTSLAESIDSQGNTPLHVAVIARSRGAAQLLLDAEVVSAEVKNTRHWTPLDEAIALKDYDMVKMILTHLRLEVKRERKARKSRLVGAMSSLPDFSMQISWNLGSPLFGVLLRRYAPSDTYTLSKVGLRLRLDGDLRGLDQTSHSALPKWKHGPFSLVVDASTSPVSAALIDHTDSTWIDLYAERKAVVRDLDADVAELIESGAGRVRLKGNEFGFGPLKTWLGGPVTAKVDGYNTQVYECTGRLVAVVLKKAVVKIPPGTTFEQYLQMVLPRDESEEVPWDPLTSPPPSVRETFAASLSDDEAALAELESSGTVGGGSGEGSGALQGIEEPPHKPVPEQAPSSSSTSGSARQISGRCWMAHDYPISLRQLLPLLEALGPANKHILAATGFLAQYKEHDVFPVKIKIPLMWAVNITLKFKNFMKLEGATVKALDFFDVPSRYKKISVVSELEGAQVEDTFYDAQDV